MRLGFGDDVPPEAAASVLGQRVRTPVGVRVSSGRPGHHVRALHAIGAGVVATDGSDPVEGCGLVLVRAGSGRAAAVVAQLRGRSGAAVVVEPAEVRAVAPGAVPVLAAVGDDPGEVARAVAAGADGVLVRPGRCGRRSPACRGRDVVPRRRLRDGVAR